MVQHFSFVPLTLNGAYLVHPFIASDHRGRFIKDYSAEIFASHGIEYPLEEVFYTESKKGVIRAIHFQEVKQQPKLVRCIKGKVFDVIVDLRMDSPTLGKWLGFYLTAEGGDELLIPEGFGHGYLVIDDAIVSYKCAEKFYGEFDSGVMWNDPDLDICWPLDQIDNLIISEKDMTLRSFKKYCEDCSEG